MAPRLDLAVIGSTGLRQYGGMLFEEFLPRLQGRRGALAYREMRDNSSTVGAIAFTIESLLRQVEWRVEPAGDSPEAKEWAEFVEGCYADMSATWEDTLGETLSMLTYGWCLPPDELVMRHDGVLVPISAVRPGDQVLTGKGRVRPVTNVFRRRHKGTVVSIRVLGVPGRIRLTSEHRIPTADGMKLASEVRRGDALLRPRMQLAPGGDYESGWLVGLQVAEGSPREGKRNRVQFALHAREVAMVGDRVDRWVRERGLEVQHHLASIKASRKTRGNSGYVALSHPEFRKLMDEWIVDGRSSTKRLTKLPDQAEFARGVWDGWQFGDAGTTISPELGWQMHMLGAALGYPSSLSVAKEALVRKTGRVTANHVVLNNAGRTFYERRPPKVVRTSALDKTASALRDAGLTYEQIAERLGVSLKTAWNCVNTPTPPAEVHKCRAWRSPIVRDDAILHRVLSVEVEDYDGEVLDLEVADDHTFCAASITVGNCFQEVVYKLRRGPENANPKYRSKFDDGRVGWRKMPIRAQDTLDRWELQEEDSGVRGMWQLDMYRRGSSTVFIPIEKALLFRFGAHKGSPEGRSMYRNAILDHWRLKRIQDIEAIGIERDMTGLLTMEVPAELLSPSATAEQVALRAELEKLLSGLKRDEREFAMVPSEMVMGTAGPEPSGYKFKLLSTGGKRQIDTDVIVKRYMNSITMSALADFLMLGTASVGSWALSSDKTRLFAMAMGATLDSICAVHNRYAIPRLMRLNGVPSKFWPELHHGDIETPPLDEVGKYITSLSMAGVLHPDEPLKRKLREIGKLPPPEEDMPLPGEEGLVPGEQPAPQETPGEPGGPPAGAAREGPQPPPGPPQRPAAPPDDDDEDDVEPGA